MHLPAINWGFVCMTRGRQGAFRLETRAVFASQKLLGGWNLLRAAESALG